MDGCEYDLAETRLVLVPSSGDSKETAHGCIGTPELQELKYLAFALE